MADRLALKRLTASDLTLFESLFRRLHAGNQKAINLNADVFISVFYPTAPRIAPTMGNEIPLSLSIFGPGGKPEHRLARKVIKNPTYKNWRLDGEFIRGPEGDPGRYDALKPGDLAIMSFHGDPVPTGLDIVFLSQDLAEDSGLHRALFSLLGNRSMVPLTEENIAAALAESGTPLEHPINELIIDPALDSALEDAALGGEKGTKALLRRRSGRTVSAADLASARLKADRIGQDGEGLINALLNQRVAAGEITDFEWSSARNAVCPYDFQVRTTTGLAIKLDVKSTTGPFENDIHISLAELIEAAEAPERYDLYRVYDLQEDGGRLRVAENIRDLARSILSGLNLPSGIKCDGFSVSIRNAGLIWQDEVYVTRPAGDEADEVA